MVVALVVARGHRGHVDGDVDTGRGDVLELYGKAVVVLSAAPSETRAGNARAWTEQTLRAQGADVRMSATVAVRRAHPDDLRDPSVSATLIRALDSFES